MKINSLNTINTNILNRFSNQSKEEKQFSSTPNLTQESNEIIGNYNISFHGLFSKKNNLPQLDARKIDFDCTLEPNIEYYINPDDIIYAGNLRIDLNSREMQSHINNIKNGKGIIFGRAATQIRGMTLEQSKQHFRLSKTKQGELLLTDLGSINGTKIERNVIKEPFYNIGMRLEPNKTYSMPINSRFIIGNTGINLDKIAPEIASLNDGEHIYIGRNEKNTYVINDEHVSQWHLDIEKQNQSILVKDLHSTNGTFFNGIVEYKPQVASIDYRGIIDTVTMQQGQPSFIPKDCQLYLGHNFTLDMRNRNILNLLQAKKHLLIGRDSSCDILVPKFYTQVSNKHIELETDGINIIARDLNSTNNTQIIPSSKVKAFYNGAENIEISQSNIGDCYLLSSIFALSRTQNGKKLIEEMVQVDKNGNYIVTFYNSMPITILPEELDGETYRNEKKLSVNGDLGLKAIERAYAKRLNYFRNNGQTMFLGIDNGGYISKAMKDLVGKSTKSTYLKLSNIDNLLNSIVYNGSNNTAITCTTPSCKRNNGYVDPEKRFIDLHAYIVNQIDLVNRQIEIKNPHNTKLSYIISFDEFKKYFDYIYTTNI